MIEKEKQKKMSKNGEDEKRRWLTIGYWWFVIWIHRLDWLMEERNCWWRWWLLDWESDDDDDNCQRVKERWWSAVNWVEQIKWTLCLVKIREYHEMVFEASEVPDDFSFLLGPWWMREFLKLENWS